MLKSTVDKNKRNVLDWIYSIYFQLFNMTQNSISVSFIYSTNCLLGVDEIYGNYATKFCLHDKPG